MSRIPTISFSLSVQIFFGQPAGSPPETSQMKPSKAGPVGKSIIISVFCPARARSLLGS